MTIYLLNYHYRSLKCDTIGAYKSEEAAKAAKADEEVNQYLRGGNDNTDNLLYLEIVETTLY